MVTVGTVDASKAVRENLTIRITLARTFLPRIKLAAFLIGLVSYICPLSIEIVEAE